MADISAEITAFKNAVYGEDVRDAMVSLANKINIESSDLNLSKSIKVATDRLYVKTTPKNIYANMQGYSFNKKGIGYSDANKKVIKYSVTSGQIIYVDNLDGYFMFQSNDTLLLRGDTNPYIIGSVYTYDGWVIVPEGATFIFTTSDINNQTSVYNGVYSLRDEYNRLICRYNKLIDIIPKAPEIEVFHINTSENKVYVKECFATIYNGERITIAAATLNTQIQNPLATSILALVYDFNSSETKIVYVYSGFGELSYNPATQYLIAIFNSALSLISTSVRCSVDSERYNWPQGSNSSNNDVIELDVCTYNIGLYNYGINDTPSDPTEVVNKMKQFFSNYTFRLLCLQEDRTQIGSNIQSSTIYTPIYSINNGPLDYWESTHTQYAADSFGRGVLDGEIQGNGRYYEYHTMHYLNKDIFIVNVHLGITLNDRILQLNQLVNIVQNHDYFIILGDFNTSVNSDNTQDQEMSIFTNEGYNIANHGYFGHLVTTHSGLAIDNIVTSNNIKISSVKVLDIYNDMPSDHLPLTAKLIVL